MRLRYCTPGCVALFAMCAVGCSSKSTQTAGESSEAPSTLSIEMMDQTLMLQVAAGARFQYDTCDLFQSLDELVGGKWVPVRDDRPGTYYQPTSVGYMLDGKFFPPTTFAGCDLVECDPLMNGNDVGVAIEYVQTGTTTPPADYVYQDPFVRPDTINVYESHPLHATRVRTHVKLFTDAACKAEHDVTLEVDVP